MRRLSGQVQPISVVIISGIIIGLVGIAYFWGIPLIEKRATITEVATAENFISELNGKIKDLVKTGAGRVEIDITRNSIRLVPNSSASTNNNTIIMEFFVDQPMIYPNATIYIGGVSCEDVGDSPWSTENFTSCTGMHGTASPEIISLKELEDLKGRYLMRMKLHYRELDTRDKGYKIVLCSTGSCETEITGKSKITLTFDKNIVITGAAANGGDLVATYINIDLI